MNGEDYLEHTKVGGELKEAISVLLENRPENPILFLADYFRNKTQGMGSNVMKAYKLITQNKVDMKSFEDNVFMAYTELDKIPSKEANGGVKGIDFIKLA